MSEVKDWFEAKSAEIAKAALQEIMDGERSNKHAAFVIDRLIQGALREAYQRGTTDAHRKEFVAETQTRFERGLSNG